MPTVRVRPGFVHGVGDRYQAGDTFTVSPAEAALLLPAFADKLEVIAEDQDAATAPVPTSAPTSAPAANPAAPAEALAPAAKPARKRSESSEV